MHPEWDTAPMLPEGPSRGATLRQCEPFRCEGKIVDPDCCVIRMNAFAMKRNGCQGGR
jgi:hypothetical protein